MSHKYLVSSGRRDEGMNISFFENGDSYVLFFQDSLKIFAVNSFTKEIIEKLNDNEEPKDVADRYNISLETVNRIVSFMNKGNLYEPVKSSVKNESKQLLKDEMTDNVNVLGKLNLNVTNMCNLSCKYCYANEGTYNSECGVMTFETAKNAIDKILEHCSGIEMVQFFGGEPLLNIELIEKVCKYFNTKKCKKPNYGLVTNGTVINDKIIEVINKYDISVTVSFDGDKKINDNNRVYKNGEGTSDIVLKNIDVLKQKTKSLDVIEATYNASHEENGVSVMDVIDFIKGDLKVEGVHVTPVSVPKDNRLELKSLESFVDAVDEGYRRKEQTFTADVISIINRIYKKEKTNRYCTAGLNVLSVSSKGDVYPCFVFTDIEEWKMTNVNNSEFFSDKFFEIYNRLKEFTLDKNEKCRKCFIKNICGSCMGNNYDETGDAFVKSEKRCEMSRRIVEKVLVNMVNSQSKR